MDDDNFLACDDFFGLLAIESAAQEKNRDDEEDGRQDFVCCVKVCRFNETSLVFVI